MRTLISSILIVLGCLLAPFALIAFWAESEIANSDAYMRDIAPLARHPAVRNAVTDRVTDEITLRLRGLGVSAGGELVREAAKAGADEDFATAWVEINQVAHRRFVAVLRGGENPDLTRQDDGVGYDLAPVYELVKQKLRSAGLEAASRLPETHLVARVLPASAVVTIDHLYDRLISLRWVLAAMSPVLIAAGVFVARDRCVALIGAGLGMAAGMLVLAIVMSAVRNVYLPDSTVGGLSVVAVITMFDALTVFLRNGLRVLFTLGLLVAGTAFVARNRLTHARSAAAFEPRPHQPDEPTNDVGDGR